MGERIEQAKATLQNARGYLNAVLDRVDNRWEIRVYHDGLQWTARELLVHLADADRGHNNQIFGYAEGREVVPEDFDLQRYNRRVTEKRAGMTVAEARASLEASRADLLRWLDSQEDAVLDREGRHASLRVMPVRGIIEELASHERRHAEDIARALSIEV